MNVHVDPLLGSPVSVPMCKQVRIDDVPDWTGQRDMEVSSPGRVGGGGGGSDGKEVVKGLAGVVAEAAAEEGGGGVGELDGGEP